MTAEEISAEIKTLIDQGADFHRQGRHALALQCYQKAITSARPSGDAGLMAFLLAQAGGEHRDCDNYYHAADLLLAALALPNCLRGWPAHCRRNNSASSSTRATTLKCSACTSRPISTL